jgi:hypothetical protein
LFVGRVVFTVTPDGVVTVQSTSGNSTDICAEPVQDRRVTAAIKPP